MSEQLTKETVARPRALDLFCSAGGATKGLQMAGYHVTGIDINPQPNYCGDVFIQADALNPPVSLSDFDFIWASPPCQDYSALKGLSGSKRGKLIPQVRMMLQASGCDWAIENVVGSDLIAPIVLCGSSFGLGVWRHRCFETSFSIVFAPECRHDLCGEPIDVTGTGGPFNGVRKSIGGGISRKPRNLAHAREVMGIDWMTRKELSQAIPPAYSHFIATAFLESRRLAA